MRDRDRRSIKEFMKAEAEQFAAEQEERNRPIREAEKQLIQTHRELYTLQRQQIETGTDTEVYVDPATLNITMPIAEAEKYNVEQCLLFRETHPDIYFNSEANNRVIVDYLVRNGIQIFSVPILEKAVQRLKEFRLLEERPEPTKPLPYEPLVTFDTPEQTETQNYQAGIDPQTGDERKYTLREINLMSADEYRRAFKITKAQLNPSGRNW
jgi:hypothetical protein